MPSTITLHRIFNTTPDRAYRAFVTPEALVKWNPPFGFTAAIEHMDVREGGSFKMSFTNFGTGSSHSFGGKYLEVKPGEKLVFTDEFDDPNMPGTMKQTVTFKKVLNGTEIKIVQEGIPDAIPAEFCYAGWQESLIMLEQLVTPEIPDNPQ